MPFLTKSSFMFFLVWLFNLTSAFASPNVVVTLKPIHSLVASIMQNVGQPQLLLPDGASPHTFQLKPSTLKQIQQADLLIWVGPDLESFMVKPLTQKHALVVTLSDIANLHKLPQRQGGTWSHHNHGTHQAHDDPHIWLSTENAQIIVDYLADYLAKIDPQHAHHYQTNANHLKKDIAQLQLSLQALLAPVQFHPFLVYHDGYQYFEKQFNLQAIGSLTTNPHLPLSPRRLKKIRELIKTHHIRCVFKETEFNEQLINNSLHHLVKVAELDPLGVHQPQGIGNYQKTLLQLGETLHACLK